MIETRGVSVGVDYRRAQETFRVKEVLYFASGGGYIGISICPNIKLYTYEGVRFTVYKLYLNKVDFKKIRNKILRS